ncbi:MAG TPA: flagellar biosynthesis anti-sigma factor FlgM [Terracidiphilus sp.]|jgi:negative regulator of flagellin synthesis FlgM|nr:flagellar biosynthesis anti-sigma factor FlgM [Terracidiphilus sp.]
MRVDLTNVAANQIAAETNPKQVSGANVASSDLSGSEDRTSFKSDMQSLNSLVGKAMGSPEIRDEKVASLQQAISSGNYKLDPQAIAGAMIDEHA